MSLIQLECKLARNYTLEEVEGALAYLLVKAVPDANAEFGTPPLDMVIVLDVSRSMHGEKLERAKEAACLIVESLSIDDWLSLVVFNDNANVMVPRKRVDDKNTFFSQIRRITANKGTRMFNGMDAGLREIAEAATSNVKQMLLFTDGQTEGESRCLERALEAAERRIVISTFGIGDDYNEELLLEISRVTLGSVYHLQHSGQIKEQFLTELESAAAIGIINANLIFHLTQGVRLNEMYRIFPNSAKLEMHAINERMFSANVGGLDKSEVTYFGAKLSVPSRSSGRVRLAQVVLKYDVPSLGTSDKTHEYGIVVEYTTDRDLCGKVDKEVIGYFDQLIAQQFIEQAAKAVQSGDVAEATQKIGQARILTQRIGNTALTQYLQNAIDELDKKGTISAGMQKTIRLGSTHTVRIPEQSNPIK